MKTTRFIFWFKQGVRKAVYCKIEQVVQQTTTDSYSSQSVRSDSQTQKVFWIKGETFSRTLKTNPVTTWDNYDNHDLDN